MNTLVQSRRHGGDFDGLSPPIKAPRSPNWNIKHYKSVEFLSNFQFQAPLHKRKAPIDDFLATVLPFCIFWYVSHAI